MTKIGFKDLLQAAVSHLENYTESNQATLSYRFVYPALEGKIPLILPPDAEGLEDLFSDQFKGRPPGGALDLDELAAIIDWGQVVEHKGVVQVLTTSTHDQIDFRTDLDRDRVFFLDRTTWHPNILEDLPSILNSTSLLGAAFTQHTGTTRGPLRLSASRCVLRRDQLQEARELIYSGRLNNEQQALTLSSYLDRTNPSFTIEVYTHVQ